MDIIQAIIDIEERAQRITDSAKELQDSYDADILAEIKVLEAKADNETAAQLELLKNQLNEEKKKELEYIESVYKEKAGSLLNLCKSNQDTWINEITKNVTQ